MGKRIKRIDETVKRIVAEHAPSGAARRTAFADEFRKTCESLRRSCEGVSKKHCMNYEYKQIEYIYIYIYNYQLCIMNKEIDIYNI